MRSGSIMYFAALGLQPAQRLHHGPILGGIIVQIPLEIETAEPVHHPATHALQEIKLN